MTHDARAASATPPQLPASTVRRAFTALAVMAGVSLAALPAHEAQAAVTIGQQVTGINAAENSIQTSSGRLFVSSDGALYELRKSGNTWAKHVVPATYTAGSSGSCYYLGLAEYQNTLYSVCTENNTLPTARKHLMAVDLSAPNPSAQSIATLLNLGVPNGLASDGAGHLFFANTGSFVAGGLWRIKLSGRFSVASQGQVYPFLTLNPNGVKFHGGQLYVTANPPLLVGTSELQRFPVRNGLLSTPTTLYRSLTFLDDFTLVKGGLIVAEWMAGTLRFINEAGGTLRTYTYPLSLPTSVTALKPGTAPGNALLVTVGSTGRAVFLETDWPFSLR